RVAHDRNIRPDVLSDLGGIDVDVNNLRLRRKAGDLTGRPVVEASADVDEQVALFERLVDVPVTVHPHQAERERVRLWERALAEEREDDRNAGALDEEREDILGSA